MKTLSLYLFTFATAIVASAASACTSTEIEWSAMYKEVSKVCTTGSPAPIDDGTGGSIPGQFIVEFKERNPWVTLEVCDTKVIATNPKESCDGGGTVYTWEKHVRPPGK